MNTPTELKLDEDQLKSIRRWMLAERQRKGMTQGDVAKKTKLSKSIISHMETGRNNMSMVSALFLLRAFDNPPPVFTIIKQRIKQLFLDDKGDELVSTTENRVQVPPA